MTQTTRQHPRFAIQVAIEVTGENGILARGATQNISRGGLCALIDHPVPNGSEVTLAMTLIFSDDAVSEPLHLPARVVWGTTIGSQVQMGASFLPLDDDQWEYLEVFLRYLEHGASDS